MTSSTRQRGRPKAFHDKTEQNTVQALDRALAVMEVVAQKPGLRLSELAEETGQATATLYRALTTLQTRGMVECDEMQQVWHIGAGAFQIGSAFLRRTNVVERSRAGMTRLMRETGETANLGVEMQDEVLFLTQVETHEAIRAFFPPGTRAPMHVSGIGKALLAWLPPAHVQSIILKRGLSAFTPHSLTDEAALRADLDQARTRGFAIDDQERAEGMRCIAAPIFNVHREPVAGISISGPAFRLSLTRSMDFGGMVREAADQVTAAIGGRCP
ncbi:helix-turn-helix domain-containing protein [Rhodobacterales bacterium LSUCC1028]|nr:helix-turn-helix domain-containing protein [Rhodobacterales bacterium LSUCC1028]